MNIRQRKNTSQQNRNIYKVNSPTTPRRSKSCDF